MITANLNYGILIHINELKKEKYNFYYTAENIYICCDKKSNMYHA